MHSFGTIIGIFFLIVILYQFKNKYLNQKTYVSVFIFLLFYMYLIFSTFNSNNDNLQHPGLSGHLNTTVKIGEDIIAKNINFYFNSKIVYDKIKKKELHLNGYVKSNLYFKNSIYNNYNTNEKILGGILNQLQKIPPLNFKKYIIYYNAILFLFFFVSIYLKKKKLYYLILGLLIFQSMILSLRLSVGWDEVFINLKHSYNLFHHGIYSVNKKSFIEGTVDFLPLYLSGLFGYFNPLNVYLIISLLGNAGIIVFSYLIIKHVTRKESFSLVGSYIMGFHPNIIWVGGTTFTAVLFTSWILASIYFILYSKRKKTGYFILSILPLIRIEGILFAFLFIIFFSILPVVIRIILNQRITTNFFKTVFLGILTAFPFFLISIIRLYYFGEFLPNPVQFKNSGLDLGYINSGLRSFSNMLIEHEIPFILLIILVSFILMYFKNKRKKVLRTLSQETKLIKCILILFIFIIPYYIGGGDWFPVKWNRYGMPFTIFALLTSIVFFIKLINIFKPKFKFVISAFIISNIIGALIYNPYLILNNNVYTGLYNAIISETGQWNRVNQLSTLGIFLKETLPEDAIIASPEVATIMYFAERDMVGLLGVGNPIIAKMPLQPMHNGDVMHRKRGVKAVYELRPDVIAFYEPINPINLSEDKLETKKIMIKELKNIFWGDLMLNISYYRGGSFEYLASLGYTHHTIAYKNWILSLWINERILKSFINNLYAKKFIKIGELEHVYHINNQIANKYYHNYIEGRD